MFLPHGTGRKEVGLGRPGDGLVSRWATPSGVLFLFIGVLVSYPPAPPIRHEVTNLAWSAPIFYALFHVHRWPSLDWAWRRVLHHRKLAAG